jgi:hypothetical protein
MYSAHLISLRANTASITVGTLRSGASTDATVVMHAYPPAWMRVSSQLLASTAQHFRWHPVTYFELPCRTCSTFSSRCDTRQYALGDATSLSSGTFLDGKIQCTLPATYAARSVR